MKWKYIPRFTDDFDFNSYLIFMCCFIVWLFSLLISIVGFVILQSFNLFNNVETLSDWYCTLLIPISCFLTAYIKYKSLYLSLDEYPTFKYKDFKKWYKFRPDNFIFEQGSVLYYSDEPFYLYHVGNRIHISKSDETRKKVIGLKPNTFLDYLLYSFFIYYLFYQLCKAENSVKVQKKQKEKEEKNKKQQENWLLFLNGLQAEVEKELKESNEIIKQQVDKLNC